jgi:EAL domain-containing protein (putative c-di-GMP-specific phosphodiesterase class I)
MFWPSQVKVAVNVSGEQLLEANFIASVVSALSMSGLPASRLELEVTESIFVRDAAQARIALEQVMALGCKVALDDFGTGYSSLSYLHKLPIHILKVDRSFVSDLGVDASTLTLTRAIVALARALDLHVIAEGVETREQAELLRSLGCDELQGFLFSRPVPADQLSACVQRLAQATADEAMAAL